MLEALASPVATAAIAPAITADSIAARPVKSDGATPGNSTARTALSNHDASSSDAAVAAIDSSAASPNACRSRRPREAPSAARMAKSRRRRDARTSSSVQAFASPITSTSAATPVSQNATRRSVAATPAPVSASKTTRRFAATPACVAAAAAVVPDASRAMMTPTFL